MEHSVFALKKEWDPDAQTASERRAWNPYRMDGNGERLAGQWCVVLERGDGMVIAKLLS